MTDRGVVFPSLCSYKSLAFCRGFNKTHGRSILKIYEARVSQTLLQTIAGLHCPAVKLKKKKDNVVSFS